MMQKKKRRVRLPGYKVVSELGRGGQGVICKAVRIETGSDVAIKFLHPRLCGDEEFRARFLREADTALTVSHPNIVKALDSGEVGDLLYYVMEFALGKPLDQILDEQGHLRNPALISFGIQAAEALDFAHELGLVHRDVKPGNFIVSPSGQVKLLDLGMTKGADDGQGLTATGMAIGTPYYMSPEVTMDAKRVDSRSDLFSLGVTLYEAATGMLPFDGDNPYLVMEKIRHEPPEPPGRLNPQLPEELEAVVMALLAKNPDLRYPTARKLKVDLERVRKGKAPLFPGSSGRAPRGSQRLARARSGRARGQGGLLRRTSELMKRLLGLS